MKRAATLLLVAVAAMTIASAGAAARPDDQPGLQGVGRAATVATIVAGDDSDRARGPGAIDAATTSVQRPDDRAGARGPGSASPQSVTRTAGGFDWTSPLPGVGLAIVLLAGGLLTLGRRHFRTPLPH